MDYLPSILITFAGLLMVLFLRGCRHKTDPATSSRPKSWSILPFFVPPLITGGPMFIAIPAALYALKEPAAPAQFAYFAFGGGAGLGIGLALMFAILMRLTREIDSLRATIEAGAQDTGTDAGTDA